jgi:hypothetical protein
MFIVDDVLLAPIHGLFWLFHKIHDTACEEVEGASERITAELSRLYMLLETGKITEAEFDAQERALLDRLDALNAQEDAVAAETDAEGLPLEDDETETQWSGSQQAA